MPDYIFEASLERIRRYCNLTKQRRLQIVFHGGEPSLVRVEKFERWCQKIRGAQTAATDFELYFQTNGTLLDASWAQVFLKYGISIGISLDGPKSVNDKFRIDHNHKGSYDHTLRGAKALKDAGVPFGLMSVIQLGEDPLEIHRHLTSLGSTRLCYIFPDYTHDSIDEVRRRYGPTPCADFMIPIFDDWWFRGTESLVVRDLWNISRIILGGRSLIETFGNEPAPYVFIETDGEIEGLDTLRSCGNRLAGTKLNILHVDIDEALETVAARTGSSLFKQVDTPEACLKCRERDTCGGGYLPHRHSMSRGFDNPSVWCADILKLFSHVRARLDVPIDETAARKRALLRLAAQSYQDAYLEDRSERAPWR